MIDQSLPKALPVRITGIDQDHLILEAKEKSPIKWPLKNIACELNVGQELTLKLTQVSTKNPAASNTEQQDKLYKMLEKLLN